MDFGDIAARDSTRRFSIIDSDRTALEHRRDRPAGKLIGRFRLLGLIWGGEQMPSELDAGPQGVCCVGLGSSVDLGPCGRCKALGI